MKTFSGGEGRGRLFEGGHLFRISHSTGVFNRGRALIRGNMVNTQPQHLHFTQFNIDTENWYLHGLISKTILINNLLAIYYN